MEQENYQEFNDKIDLFIEFVKKIYVKMDQMPALCNREPGYLKKLLPNQAPEKAEDLSIVLKDFEDHILTGITNWQGPSFHAYFPAGRSYPSLMGGFLADLMGVIGFTWSSSPSATELEIIVLNWLAKSINLPECLWKSQNTLGVIQTSMSETTLLSLLAARNKAINDLKSLSTEEEKLAILSKLVAYTSDQSHSSVERAGLLALIKMRKIVTNESRSIIGDILSQMIEKDKQDGLIPFFFVATLGTTGSCAFDCLETCGKVCQENNVWMHVDAAYAGSAFLCPEYQHYLKGVEYAMSYAFNPHKWMLVNFDCTVSWFKNINYIHDAFKVNPYYLQHNFQKETPDYRNFQIPLGRRFRSLKIWFVLRCYGLEKIQNYIKNHIRLAHEFEKLLLEDDRFEIVDQVRMALVCFRLKRGNEPSRRLLDEINSQGKIYLINSIFERPEPIFYLRFAVCYQFANMDHIHFAVKTIFECTDKILADQS